MTYIYIISDQILAFQFWCNGPWSCIYLNSRSDVIYTYIASDHDCAFQFWYPIYVWSIHPVLIWMPILMSYVYIISDQIPALLRFQSWCYTYMSFWSSSRITLVPVYMSWIYMSFAMISPCHFLITLFHIFSNLISSDFSSEYTSNLNLAYTKVALAWSVYSYSCDFSSYPSVHVFCSRLIHTCMFRWFYLLSVSFTHFKFTCIDHMIHVFPRTFLGNLNYVLMKRNTFISFMI